MVNSLLILILRTASLSNSCEESGKLPEVMGNQSTGRHQMAQGFYEVPPSELEDT